MGYEENYHDAVHSYLLNDAYYYQVRSKVALKKYFKDVSPNSKVLEFGCGLGQNIALLKNAYGYDISKFALDFCKNKNIHVFKTIEEISNDSFDVVFSCHHLEHVENPYETLKAMKQKLKKDGKLILVLPKEKHKKPKSFELDEHQHLYCWTFRTINNLLIKSGFKIISNKYECGKGYKKMLPISKINLKFYIFLTKLTAKLFNSKEMIIEAVK